MLYVHIKNIRVTKIMKSLSDLFVVELRDTYNFCTLKKY